MTFEFGQINNSFLANNGTAPVYTCYKSAHTEPLASFITFWEWVW